MGLIQRTRPPLLRTPLASVLVKLAGMQVVSQFDSYTNPRKCHFEHSAAQ